MVEVAVVEVALNDLIVRAPARTASPFTESKVPGVEVPIPILEFNPSIEKIDAAVGEVANENAFTAEGRVEVADVWNASVSDAAEDEANVMTLESRKVSPATEKVVAGVTVAIPRRRFVASTVRKFAESRVVAPE